MACGCGDRCTCTIVAGDNISVTGSGDVSDPYVVSGLETEFEATNTDNTIVITPGGPSGHNPVFNTAVSGNPGNVLVKVGDGLFVGATATSVAVRYIGEVIDASGVSTPGLCLEADGSEFPVATYPDLSAEYGATGVGDGLWDNHPQLGLPAAGNFRVPDLQRRQTIGKGSADTVGTTDGIAYASRSNTHTHTGPSHSHSFTPAGTLAVVGLNTDAATGAEPDNFHTGYIIRESGRTKLVGGADGLVSVDLAPTGAASADAFAKMNHSHAIAGHNHLFTGTPDSTGAAGTGATSAATTPSAVVRKVVFAGV